MNRLTYVYAYAYECMPWEAPPTKYEEERAQNMMRNNLVLQNLGVSKLALLLKKSSAKRKANEPEDSSSLYEDEEIEQGVVDKVSGNVPRKNMARNISMPSGGTRVSKRVMATAEQDQSTRMTRQRTRELCSTEDGTTINPQDASTEGALVASNSSSPTQPDDQIIMSNEGEPNAMVDRWNRGRSMGKDLERISRGLCTKIPVHIAEGKRRPEAPMQAAKLASEGGIILRQHIPILPHWKQYKNDKSQLANYMDKVAGQFAIDTNNKPVKDACSDLLKCGQRQMRYRLKNAYFNGIPANQVRTTSPLSTMNDDQWKALVDMWSDPKHKDKCVKNKNNRANVHYQQKTGSRCFIAHCHVVKQTKYKDAPPTAIDLFKECHLSSKTGFSESVQNAIANMEAIVADSVQEGQAPKTDIEVVSQALPKSKFLQNIGLEPMTSKGSDKAAIAHLKAQLETKSQEASDLRDALSEQQEELDSLKKKVDESEAVRKQQGEEVENLKKSSDETNALLRRLIALSASSFGQLHQ